MTKNFTLTDFNLEIQVLIRAGEAVFSSEKKADFDIFLQNKRIDWETVYQLASFHQIRPLLLRGVSGLPNSTVPESFLIQLKQDCQKLSYHGLRQTQELLRLLDLYKKHNITAIPYKGVWLASTYYGGFGMREFSDIDIFVYEKEIPEIKKIMLSEGYVPYWKLTPAQELTIMKTLCEYNFMLFDKDNNRLFHIEPHYKSNGKSDGASFLALNDLAPNLKTMPFVNTSIQRFSVEDTLLLTCLHHGMKEGWTLLKYLFDVYAILKKEEKTINWVYIFEKAAQLDIKTTFLISLSLLTRLFNMTFADNVLLKIQDKKVQNLTENRLKNLNNLMVKPNPVSTFLFNLQCMEAWSSRLKVLYYRIIYPHPTDIQFLSLPPYLFFLYFFIRPMRGLIKLLAFYH